MVLKSEVVDAFVSKVSKDAVPRRVAPGNLEETARVNCGERWFSCPCRKFPNLRAPDSDGGGPGLAETIGFELQFCVFDCWCALFLIPF